MPSTCCVRSNIFPPLGPDYSLIFSLARLQEHCLAIIEYDSFCECSQRPRGHPRAQEPRVQSGTSRDWFKAVIYQDYRLQVRRRALEGGTVAFRVGVRVLSAPKGGRDGASDKSIQFFQ